ncbi:MAG TPA: hypothetical protein VJX71_22075 [Methylomirabilota bacterium]|nr:hypothetical protein [Methylomirabilota bacterium]
MEFEGVQQWSADMEESYLARSSQNRWWIYVAGTLGLATVAASGGLAAAGAVGLGTIALLNVSGGFATGFFAVLNNSDLATAYTLAASDIATARSEATQRIEEVLAKAPSINTASRLGYVLPCETGSSRYRHRCSTECM